MAKLKDLLNEDITTMGGVVSGNAFSNIDMGFRTQHPKGNNTSTKLTNIVEDMYGEQKPKINVKEFVHEVGNFNSYGKEITYFMNKLLNINFRFLFTIHILNDIS
jgi:hypothetical protein